jgi:alkylation response protein AidB-like acyl-CoA dehydrogenase
MLMDFDLPADLVAYLAELDVFIAAEITPLEQADDNIRFFDHRREWARTDFENGGLPRHEWEELLTEATRRADAAGHWRFSAPKKYGGKDGSNLWMAVIREHFAAKGLGLHNDLQNEHSIVGNFPFVAMFEHFGTPEQQQEFIFGGFERRRRVAFGLTEPEHGSDATHMETRAVRETRDGVPAGASMARRCGPPGCTSPRIAPRSRAPAGRTAMPRASPAFSCPIPPTGW